MKNIYALLILVCFHSFCYAEDGYGLWLRYNKISNEAILQQYRTNINRLHFYGTSPSITVAKEELKNGLHGLLDEEISVDGAVSHGSVIVYSRASGVLVEADFDYDTLGKEGFHIRTINALGKHITLITAQNDAGLLYGVYHFLRLLQSQQDIRNLDITSIPGIMHRILNHWDNPDRHVERGYAGNSIWNWHTMPGYIDKRYIDYARANASIGINGTVLTNVNANALVLTENYLLKVKALADAFRPYGIKVYLTARFSAPMETGKLRTADPLNDTVRQWWNNKAKEIYELIPDFGGFLVKANSEGQPGPQNYGKSHADGANMLADAVAPFGGIIMWRAFVYSNDTPEDRFKQAYNEFKPLDGKFRKNVLIQVKNGPIDFQPREPFSPLFGAMPQTPLMMEFQITQEYLGQGTHLVYESPMFKEVLESDTWQKGKGSTVAKVIDGSLHHYSITGIAGVANIGSDRNWTGHLFGQSNWYAFGRQAWDHDLTAIQIADEWVKQTFDVDEATTTVIKNIMMGSWETAVNYMTPLGLHHIMGTGHHYGPAPWVNNAGRADWNPVYYHRADEKGIGFDRTKTGSDALSQYAPEVRKIFSDMNTCPEKYLLWFHHVPWDFKMRSGRTLWEELCYKYHTGVDSVRAMRKQWNEIQGKMDEERFRHVQMLLNIQVEEAIWWRDACLLYFQTFSKMPIPAKYEKPSKSLEYYKQLKFPFAPGQGR